MESTTFYFEQPGEINREKTLELAKLRADALGIKSIVVASTIGKTGVLAVQVFKGYKVIVVTHVFGFREPNTNEFLDKNREFVENHGGIVLTAAHAFGGLQRALAPEGTHPHPGLAMGDVIAMALRTFGQGTKVALECAAMAADAGYVRSDEDIVSIGGTGLGADTALVLRPAPTHRFFNTRVHEIICKPRL